MKETQLALVDARFQRPALPKPEDEPLDVTIEQVFEDEEVKMALFAKKPLTLQGIHFSMHTPTEERLTAQFDGLTPELFRKLGMRFEDWSRVVDDLYKLKTTRGRGWQGRGHRVTMPKTEDESASDSGRVRVIRASPFPSSFSNILRTIRRDLYFTLRRHCLVLEGEQHGGYKQNIYILPYANAPSLMAEMQIQNGIIDELNQRLQDFMGTRDYRDFVQILSDNGIPVESLSTRQWHIEHISFDATPLSLEPATVMEMVRTARGTIKSELREEEQRGMEDLHAELERKRQTMVTQALNSLKKEVDHNVAKIIAGIKKNPDRAKRELEQLRNKAVSVGLDSLATSVIDPLSQLIDNPERVCELFGTVNVSELPSKVDGKIRSLIEAL